MANSTEQRAKLAEEEKRLQELRGLLAEISTVTLARFSALFPNYVWIDPPTAIDLMAAEIQTLRGELEDEKASGTDWNFMNTQCLNLLREILGTRNVHGVLPGIETLEREVLARESIAERRQQDTQWGGPAHDDTHHRLDWTRYMKKFISRAEDIEANSEDHREYEYALTQVRALTIAAVQSSRRNRNKMTPRQEQAISDYVETMEQPK